MHLVRTALSPNAGLKLLTLNWLSGRKRVRTALSPNAGLKPILYQSKAAPAVGQNSAKPERGIETIRL